jgi:hypothetical protein
MGNSGPIEQPATRSTPEVSLADNSKMSGKVARVELIELARKSQIPIAGRARGQDCGSIEIAGRVVRKNRAGCQKPDRITWPDRVFGQRPFHLIKRPALHGEA